MNTLEDFTNDLLVTAERVREVEVEGIRYRLRATDPYGFWHIQLAKPGTLPQVLRGSFTNHELAKRAIKNYHDSLKKEQMISTTEDGVKTRKTIRQIQADKKINFSTAEN